MRAVCILLAALTLACSPPNRLITPTPNPTSTPGINSPLPLSGRVLDDNGVPVSGAFVGAVYAAFESTHTNDRGEYAVQVWSASKAIHVYSLHDGYEWDIQWVLRQAEPIVRDLRLIRTRTITAGDSVVVAIHPTNSLCGDLENFQGIRSRCAIVAIESGGGTLRVEVQPAAGEPSPSFLWYTTNSRAGTSTHPNTFVIPVSGGISRVMIGIPDGAPAQQFNVTTSLQ